MIDVDLIKETDLDGDMLYLSKLFGINVVRTLVQEYGGDMLYIPNVLDKKEQIKRYVQKSNEPIVMNKENIKELSNRFGITKSYMRRLLKTNFK